MTSPPFLTASDLGIMRGERVLFTKVSLEVSSGEALLLRGANGAGKTTLLRVLAGLTSPETGTRTAQAFHWVGHRPGLKPHETPRRHLMLWARAWGADTSSIDAILDRLGLKRPADVPAAQLSAGQNRRAALARTQLVERPLWLLDEPFSALDGDGKALVAELIAEQRARGGAVIAAVHGDVPVSDARQLVL